MNTKKDNGKLSFMCSTSQFETNPAIFFTINSYLDSDL